MRKKIILGLVCVLAITVTYAQDSLKTTTLNEVVVTGTKFEVPVEKSGKVIFKISQRELQQRATLSDALNNVAGIQIDGAFGAPGANLSYFVRGGRSKNSLVLLDGVPLTDPTGIDPMFDLRFINTNQLESVEVLQGGLSTLYGSGASASVINLQTKKLATDGVHGSVALNGGSWNSFGENLGVYGKQGIFTFQVGLSSFSSDGFSAALDKDGTDSFDKDGFKQRNGYLKVGLQLTDRLSVKLFGNYDWFDTDFDAGAFTDSDDENEQKQKRFGISGEYNYEKGKFSIISQFVKNNREYTGSYPSIYEGENYYAEVINSHELSKELKLLSGGTFQKLTYDEKKSFTPISKDTTSFYIIDPYASIFLDLPVGFNLHAGFRVNNHSEYGSKFLYNINPSWFIGVNHDFSIKPFVSLSTSFIAPTLFQLYTPWGGNDELKAEESQNIEYGTSIYFDDKVELTFVNYFREETNVIDYNLNSFEYYNVVDKRNVKGVTISTKITPHQRITISGNFSWVTSNNSTSFLRIPARKAGANVVIDLGKEFLFSVNYQYTSSRTDIYYDEFFNGNRIELNDYSLFDVTASKKLLKDKFRIYGSIFNLFDKDFIGVYGYTTKGRNFTLGATYNF